jgi:hypothetical protein
VRPRRGTCEAIIGLGTVPLAESLAGASGCPEPATVTLRSGCIHEHMREGRFCAAHGAIDPADGVWLCLACAELGHDCPIIPVVVA